MPKNTNSKKTKLLLSVVILAAIALASACTGNSESKESESSEKLSLKDTDYTGVKEDVLTNQTFDCEPRNEDEWYRTDRTLVVDPKNPKNMYVSVEYKGVFKSTDGGKNWKQAVKGIKVYARSDDKTKGCYSEYPVMRMDPNNSKRLILGLSSGGGGFLNPTGQNAQVGGVTQTTNAAKSWDLMINDKMNTYVNDVAIDSTDSDTVYYSTSSSPASFTEADQTKIFVSKGLIYKTTNSGKTWKELPTGIGNRTSVTSIHLNPKNPDQIVAPTFSAIRLSNEKGGTGISTGKDTSVEQLGILTSNDGGKSWTAIQLPGSPPILRSYVAPTNFSRMYFAPSLASGKPIGFVTTDGMKTFKETKLLEAIAYDPNDSSGDRMIGYTFNSTDGPAVLRLFESRDGGVTWNAYGTLPKEIQDLNNRRTRVQNIIWQKEEPNTLYMSGANGYVWKSVDLGQTWETLLSVDKLNSSN